MRVLSSRRVSCFPSPPWGRGWLAAGVVTSRGETGEGVHDGTAQPNTSGSDHTASHTFSTKQLRRLLNHALRKPQDRVPQALKISVPPAVPASLARLSMHASVELDNQAPLRAVEIDNVRTQRLLPAEFEALELNAPQQAPRGLFGFGRSMTNFAPFLDWCAPPPRERVLRRACPPRALSTLQTPSPVSPRRVTTPAASHAL